MDLKDAGFTNDADAMLETPEDQPPTLRISEVRQLIAPLDAVFPRELEKLVFSAKDLAELGHRVYEAEVAESKLIILCVGNDAAVIALQYPTQFRLKPAILRNIPGVDYHPRFNQAVFGCSELTWGFVVDSLGLDEKLKFDVDAIKGVDDDDDDGDAPAGAPEGDGNESV